MKHLLILLAISVGWAVPAFAYDFDHALHLEILEGMPCSTCHQEEAEQIRPEREVCLDCHDEEFVDEIEFPALKTHGPVWTLNHRPYAKMSDYDCASCHQQEDCLECHTDAGRADEFGELGNNMINVHRSDFTVTHPISARTNPQLCSSCHENRFCVECHQEFQVGPASGPSHLRTFNLGLDSSFSDITQIHQNLPDGFTCDDCHTEGAVATDMHEWTSGHKREARKNLTTCQACHPSGDVCITCHSDRGGVLSANPHGSGWGDRADNLKDASDGKTCRRCHNDF